MRTFKQGNWSNDDSCLICGTQKAGEVILIPIVGTKEGNNIQAKQVHTDCLQEQLMYYPENDIIAAVCTKPIPHEEKN